MYSNMYIYNRLEHEEEHIINTVWVLFRSVTVGSTQQNANKYDLKTWLSTYAVQRLPVSVENSRF